jgi:CRISPR-associated protein Csm2
MFHFFWEDKENNIPHSDLFSDKAKVASEKQSGFNKDGKTKKIAYSQLRNFYDEIVRYKSELAADENKWKQKFPYIKMLNAKFAYSYARGHITDECKQFWTERINEIQDQQDFIVFADFFEAFMAYYKQYDKKDNKKEEGARNEN